MNKVEANNESTRFSSGVNIMFSAWLMVSPFLLGYTSNTLALWNSLLVGLVAFVLAWFRMLRPDRSALPSVVNLLLGAWLAASPFVLGLASDYAVMWNNFAVGLAIVFFSIIGLLLTAPAAKA